MWLLESLNYVCITQHGYSPFSIMVLLFKCGSMIPFSKFFFNLIMLNFFSCHHIQINYILLNLFYCDMFMDVPFIC